ncbi:hypothetical protein HG530_010022 [Fusarium avenaceum]|nr:hypothetical protein HG530_010022 [Fusarium avenaceum]
MTRILPNNECNFYSLRIRNVLSRQPPWEPRLPQAPRRKMVFANFELVNVNGTLRDVLCANGVSEANHVDDNSSNVSSISTPVKTAGKIVWTLLTSVVEFFGIDISLADEVVVGYHDTSDRAEEDAKLPGANSKTDNSTHITSSSNIDPAWEKSCQIGTGAHTVGGDVGAELGKGESRSNEEDTKALSRASIIDELVEQVKGMSHLVDWEPEGWERAKPEDEERNEMRGIRSRVLAE